MVAESETGCRFWVPCWEEGCEECGGPPPVDADDGDGGRDWVVW